MDAGVPVETTVETGVQLAGRTSQSSVEALVWCIAAGNSRLSAAAIVSAQSLAQVSSEVMR